MRDAENIREVEALGIDLMGFIFWPKSSRYVSHCPSYLPNNVKRVGVFVDEDIEEVKHIAHDYALDFIQLHGSESPEYCTMLKGHHLIKAFNIATPADFGQTLPYEGVADIFLFDTKGPSVGGNGKKFDWSLLAHYSGRTPFLLSGGIGPDDAASLMAFHHEQCIGIDLNSRFEQSPGLKDIGLLRRFLSQLSNQTH
jgi:phosphoribosylanthranilate isomerase